MVNTTPVIGRNGWLLIGTTVVGYLKGFTLGIKRGSIKEYKYESADPCLLEAGNASYPFTVDRIWIDSTYAALVLAGTAGGMTIEVAPESSTPTGQSKITLSNAILTDWTVTSTQEGAVLEKVAGEGKTIAFTTYA